MALTMDEVQRVLDVEEPNYRLLAERLGSEALPALSQLLNSPYKGVAAKATYLAGVIGTPAAVPIVERALESEDANIRVAAAGAAANLPRAAHLALLPRLLLDRDPGVKNVALNAVPPDIPDLIRARIEQLRISDPEPFVRELSKHVLDRLR